MDFIITRCWQYINTTPLYVSRLAPRNGEANTKFVWHPAVASLTSSSRTYSTTFFYWNTHEIYWYYTIIIHESYTPSFQVPQVMLLLTPLFFIKHPLKGGNSTLQRLKTLHPGEDPNIQLQGSSAHLAFGNGWDYDPPQNEPKVDPEKGCHFWKKGGLVFQALFSRGHVRFFRGVMTL